MSPREVVFVTAEDAARRFVAECEAAALVFVADRDADAVERIVASLAPALRPLTFADLAPFAKTGHSSCDGRGFVTFRGGSIVPAQSWRCHCTTRALNLAIARGVVARTADGFAVLAASGGAL